MMEGEWLVSTDNQPAVAVAMHPDRLKHLEMLQQVITRMASNSFLIKGWSITLISALLAFAAKDKIHIMAWVALLPCLAFWMLDAYFLRQERLFRKLYDHYRLERPATPSDFGMNTRNMIVDSTLKVMFSQTLSLFHGVLAALIIAIIVAVQVFPLV